MGTGCRKLYTPQAGQVGVEKRTSEQTAAEITDTERWQRMDHDLLLNSKGKALERRQVPRSKGSGATKPPKLQQCIREIGIRANDLRILFFSRMSLSDRPPTCIQPVDQQWELRGIWPMVSNCNHDQMPRYNPDCDSIPFTEHQSAQNP